jgi:hypothetical protein
VFSQQRENEHPVQAGANVAFFTKGQSPTQRYRDTGRFCHPKRSRRTPYQLKFASACQGILPCSANEFSATVQHPPDIRTGMPGDLGYLRFLLGVKRTSIPVSLGGRACDANGPGGHVPGAPF